MNNNYQKEEYISPLVSNKNCTDIEQQLSEGLIQFQKRLVGTCVCQNIDCLVVEVGEAANVWFQLIKFGFRIQKEKIKIFNNKKIVVENEISDRVHLYQMDLPRCCKSK